MNEIICIGSSSKDIFFPVGSGVIFDTPEDLTSQKKIAFELGAKFQAKKIFEAPGGCSANVSQGLARLSVKVACYTKIGKDNIGNWIKKELKKEGVSTKLIQTDKKCKSDLSAIIVDKKSKEHLVFFNRDANQKLDLNARKLVRTKRIFISALNGDWEKHFDDILTVSRKNNIKIIFNPGQRNIQDNSRKIIEMIKKSEILVLNKDEAIEILKDNASETDKEAKKINDEKYLIKKLKKYGPKIVVLTDGKNGVWVLEKGSILFAQPEISDNEVVDTLGAGDAFSSGFLAGISNGENIENSLRWGMANSSSVIKHYGAKEGLLKKDEIKNEIENIKIMEL